MAACKTAERANSAKCNTLPCHVLAKTVFSDLRSEIPRIPSKDPSKLQMETLSSSIINLKFHTNSYSWIKTIREIIESFFFIIPSIISTSSIPFNWNYFGRSILGAVFPFYTCHDSLKSQFSFNSKRTTKAGQSGVPFERWRKRV